MDGVGTSAGFGMYDTSLWQGFAFGPFPLVIFLFRIFGNSLSRAFILPFF